VKVVFEALRAEYKDKKLTAILQPHQLQRVLEFREEFILEMKKFDKVYLYSIFTAREDFNDLKNRL
jgi:UDP-N-acetylmuramate-alanine ligase